MGSYKSVQLQHFTFYRINLIITYKILKLYLKSCGLSRRGVLVSFLRDSTVVFIPDKKPDTFKLLFLIFNIYSFCKI